MASPDLHHLFRRLPGSGPEACAWADQLEVRHDLRRAWEMCPRGDWLLWIAGILAVDRTLVTEAACDCARFAVALLPEARVERLLRDVIAVADAWARGVEGADACRAEAEAVLRIYKQKSEMKVNEAEAPTEGYAAAAVSAAVNVPTFESAFGVACAAASAALAAAQVATPNDEGATDAAHLKCADLVRDRIGYPNLVATLAFTRYAMEATAEG